MATPSRTTSGGGSGSSSSRRRGGARSRDNAAKVMAADQITQAIQSTSNLLQCMHQSSPSQACLVKLPKNLLSKTSTVRNTGQVLDQLPRVISSLDAHMDSGLQSVPHLKTVIQLLANMENCQLSSLCQSHPSHNENYDGGDHHPVGS